MEISNYTPNEPAGLEALFEEFKAQSTEGVLEPEFLELNHVLPNDGLLVAREIDEPILGILHYELDRPKSFEELNSQFRRHFPSDVVDGDYQAYEDVNLSEIDGFRKYDFVGDFPYIKQLESFQRDRGVGRTLVENLMAQENISGIFLQSLSDVIGFYLKMGFEHSGLYLGNTEAPIMVWMKSGFY